jgi:hypothetical protein
MGNITSNFYYLNQGPLDAKMQPLQTIDDLLKIERDYLYEGIELTVLNINKEDKNDVSNIPTRFTLKYNENFEFTWKVKDTLTVKNNAEIDKFKPYLSEGTKIIVLSDETNKGQLTEYISTHKIEVTNGIENTIVKLKKLNNDGVITSDELALDKLNNHEIGTLIYLQDTIYSYTNKDLIIYTDNLKEAQGKTGFTEIPTGFYILQLIEDKEVLSQMIVNNTINSINIPIIGDDI